MIEEKLYNLKSFSDQYKAIMLLSVGDSIVDLDWTESREALLERIDWNNVLGIASVLCRSNEAIYLDAALRIAQTCLVLQNCSSIQKNAAAYILECLTNNLAIKRAVEHEWLACDYADSFSLQQKIDRNHNIFQSSILVGDHIYGVNKFQYEVYKCYQNNDVISISAPTSAGKSYILYTILTESVLTELTNVVYIVPTRALISQVEADLDKYLKSIGKRERVSIMSVPTMTEDLDLSKSNVFVFTQERLHWFITNNAESLIPINLLIVDEAHKIDDGNRGILLQQKLEELVKLNENIKVYFSSPFTSNPEVLLDNVYLNVRKEKVNTQFVSVNQNLIYVTQVPRNPRKWHFELVTTSESLSLGCMTLQDNPNSELKKVALIAHLVGQTGACIIYSNGAAEAENVAHLLFNTIQDNELDQQIVDLIQLVKQTIHPNYALATVLNKRIAFHYGNMPLLIRNEIERLFAEGHIKYLVCTSTLLEGVNLPAKSIIIRNPHRGRRNPLNANDFWNLAGRAGRWGKEYNGNIICIEPEKWDVKPNPNKSKQIISRAIDSLASEGEAFLNYISDDTPRERMNSKWESAFAYYYIKYIIEEEVPEDDEFKLRLYTIIKLKSECVKLPDYIIKRNPGISPIAQQQLFDYFSSKGDAIDEYIPVYPNDANAYEEYVKLIGRIGKTIANYPPQLNTSRAVLLVNWMSGKPLSYIIKRSYESYQRNNCSKSLPTIIREVMDNIENFVRYSFSKDSSCYIDILRYYLELQGRDDLIELIPQMNLWLEFGVSEKTHLSLLALGLSRSTVITLSEKYITNTHMTRNECLMWLRSLNLESLEISPIMKDDISKVL